MLTQATHTHTTSRRNLGLATLAALAVPTLAKAAMPNPDAKLIALCDRWLALHHALAQLYACRHTIADEKRTEPELIALYDRQGAIEEEFGDLAPATHAGAVALARVGLANCVLEPNDDGERVAENFEEWVYLSVLEFVVGEGKVS